MRKIILAIVIILPFLAGCVSQHQQVNRKTGSMPYIPVSGNVYNTQGIRFQFGCPSRTDGTDEYVYSLKKGAISLASPVKYLLFDVTIHNPLQREISIPAGSIKLIGYDRDTYLPLDQIVPDTNKTRFLVRNTDQFQQTVFVYGIIAFEPVAEWEHELKLQFQIDIDEQTDYHYVIFHRSK